MTAALILAAAPFLELNAADSTASEGDREFVAKAAADGAAEVELGRLAAKKASSPAVRQYGEQMARDHTRAGEELKKYAAAAGITASAMPDAAQSRVKARLEKLSGTKFDEEYIRLMRENHRMAVDLFKSQSQNGTDPGLKKFAAATLPALESHKKMADDLQGKK
jgi:putative membrane protein